MIELVTSLQLPVVCAVRGWAAGLGFRFVYDSRDNYFSTRKGAYAAVQGMFYAEALGGTHSYSLFTVDVRKYLPLWFGHTLALQAYGASTYWDVPFSHLPILGGQFRMRGYFEGRFRDNNAVITQAEYRFPIAWRFGGVAFGSVGMVAPSLLDFKLKDIKGAAGGGLRFMFDRDERLNGRFDVVVGGIREHPPEHRNVDGIGRMSEQFQFVRFGSRLARDQDGLERPHTRDLLGTQVGKLFDLQGCVLVPRRRGLQFAELAGDLLRPFPRLRLGNPSAQQISTDLVAEAFGTRTQVRRHRRSKDIGCAPGPFETLR